MSRSRITWWKAKNRWMWLFLYNIKTCWNTYFSFFCTWLKNEQKRSVIWNWENTQFSVCLFFTKINFASKNSLYFIFILHFSHFLIIFQVNRSKNFYFYGQNPMKVKYNWVFRLKTCSILKPWGFIWIFISFWYHDPELIFAILENKRCVTIYYIILK